MTDPADPSEPDQTTTPRWRRVRSFTDHPLVKAAATASDIVQGIGPLITVVGIVVAASGLWWIHRLGDGHDPDMPAPVIASSAPASRVDPVGSATPSATPADASCWTAGRAPIDCRERHRYEAVEPNVHPCSLEAVTTFLGGRWPVDVTVARPVEWANSVCVVDAGRDVRGASKDVLLSRAATWRKCFDERLSRVVSCAVIHTGEFVGTGNLRRANQSECIAAATAYMNQSTTTVGEDLRIEVLDARTGMPIPERCRISARGNHLLVDSVRRLGVNPVPLAG